jgi:hypothetical protein
VLATAILEAIRLDTAGPLVAPWVAMHAQTWRPNNPEAEQGFALVEALVATLILAGGVLSLSYVSLASARAQATVRDQAILRTLARDKLERLRGLAWSSVEGVPVSDTSTDTSIDPETPGGTGLDVSPGGTLLTNTPGYCDFFDAQGHWAGRGGTAPAGAVWARRWAVSVLTGAPDTVIIEVVVVPIRFAGRGVPLRTRTISGAHLVAVRSRVAR